MELALPQREQQQVEIWRGKRIDEITREEAIQALKDCATAYRDHLNDEREVWERHQRWGYPRAKEALACKRSEGARLGRPTGKLSSVTKLSGKDDLIQEYLQRKIPQTVMARLLNVSRLTLRNYIITRKLNSS